jgi:hypothetical protein
MSITFKQFREEYTSRLRSKNVSNYIIQNKHFLFIEPKQLIVSLIHWIPGALSQGVKRPGHEAEHSPSSSAQDKNGGAIPPLPIHLHGVVFN